MNETQAQRPWIIYGLILLGVVARLVPHPWNTTPVMAIALFGGTYFSKRWAILLPLITLITSDALIGWHRTMVFSWTAFALTGMLAWWIRPKPAIDRILIASLTGSLLFFFITNFGVWVCGGIYPHTQAGLRDCFIAAVPFYRNTLLGDLIYTTAFFGVYSLLRRPQTTAAGAKS